jgi:1,4-alpha-glucan branching enzyme
MVGVETLALVPLRRHDIYILLAHADAFKVGISSPNMRVTTYKEFETDVLPRIKALGYNTIQM